MPLQQVDQGGIVFEGPAKDIMLDAATHALNCANLLRDTAAGEPICFFADSDDLVQYMVQPVSSEWDTTQLTPSELRSHEVKSITNGRIVARGVASKPTLHLDMLQFHPGSPVEHFDGTFVDLYLGLGARCISHGLGNYAYLATRIANTLCVQTHENFGPLAQHRFDLKHSPHTMVCPLPTY